MKPYTLFRKDKWNIPVPCQGCQKRTYNCHFEGQCQDYDEYRARMEEARVKRNAEEQNTGKIK